MQCACAVLPSVSSPALSHFSVLSHTSRENWGAGREGGEGIEYEICAFIFSTSYSDIFLVLKRIHRGFIINLHKSSCKVPVILGSFNENSIFSKGFRKIFKFQI